MPTMPRKPGPFAPAFFAATFFAPTFFPGLPRSTPLHVPPSVTGWRSTGRRRGPDPFFTSAARRAGIAPPESEA